MTPYLPLINTFDAIGWVPTIRGSLSLNVFDDSKSILGDVDKFSVEIKTYNNDFSSSRYLAACSLFAVDDNKKGWHYRRAFRFIFRGTIDDKEKQSKFITEMFKNEQISSVKKLFEEKELLIGKLSIMAIPNKLRERELTEQEKNILLCMNELSKKKQEYIKADSDGYSFERLDRMRSALKEQWVKVETQILEVEKDEGGNPVYKFDVILSRDGILFLKDDTCAEFKKHYFTADSASDYRKNIPLHGIFKMSLHFVTSLFHMNYHHSPEHDAFLPATNLHPIRTNTTLKRIIKHQLESFLSPVIKIKRDINDTNANIICNPAGVLPYAEAFLYVFENNKFLPKEEADLLHKFIDTQKKEFEALSSDNKAIYNSFLSQDNFVTRLTVSLAVLVAVIQTFGFLFKDSDVFCRLGTEKMTVLRTVIILISFGLGWTIHRFVIQRIIYREKFIRKRKRNFLNQDSNIDKGKLSRLYAFRLFWINIKLQIKKSNINIFIISGLIIFIGVIVLLWWTMYLYLLG
jgi:hypothetical protein